MKTKRNHFFTSKTSAEVDITPIDSIRVKVRIPSQIMRVKDLRETMTALSSAAEVLEKPEPPVRKLVGVIALRDIDTNMGREFRRGKVYDINPTYRAETEKCFDGKCCWFGIDGEFGHCHVENGCPRYTPDMFAPVYVY